MAGMGGMDFGGLASGINQAAAGTFGLIDGIFGKNEANRAKRRALNYAVWQQRRNDADINKFGTQQALDYRKLEGEQNAKSQQFVQNQGLAGSTIQPTLMAGNAMRRQDALARLAQSIAMARIGNRNNAGSTITPLLSTPNEGGWAAKLAANFAKASGNGGGGMAGGLGQLAGMFGGKGNADAAEAALNSLTNPQGTPNLGGSSAPRSYFSSDMNSYAAPAKSGYYGPKFVE